MTVLDTSIPVPGSWLELSGEHAAGFAGAPLDLLPIAVCVCGHDGRIVRFNRAAANLWGCSPQAGEPGERYCGSRDLNGAGGKSPLADVLATGVPVRGREIAIERPDGVRVAALAYVTPFFDAAGKPAGAVTVLADRTGAHLAEKRLAAIVESSDDAIIGMDVNGTLTSWNKGAEQLYGYSAEEAIGKPVTILIPPERQDEEASILARIRRGERIDRYETVRRRKDGSEAEISLTVSPIEDAQGTIAGASKIARDISGRKRAEQQQALLLREMNHRIKNLFTVAGSIVALSAHEAGSAQESGALRPGPAGGACAGAGSDADRAFRAWHARQAGSIAPRLDKSAPVAV